MNSIRNIASVSYAFFLSLGIGIASITPKHLHIASILLFICFGCSIIGLLLLYKSPRLGLGLNKFLFVSAFLIGYILYLLHLPDNQAKHLTHFYKENIKQRLQIEIVEVLRTTPYYQQYIAQVKQIDQKSTHGRVLLRVPVKDSLEPFYPGYQKLVYTSIQALAAPANPFDIDMQKYYRSLNLFHSTKIDKDSKYIVLNTKPKSSWLWRRRVLKVLNKAQLNTNSKQLIQAMVLGYRDEWSVDRRTRYSDAGVAHILAISGLHIGVLYSALFWMLLPLQRLWNTRVPVYSICLLGLWIYAWFTGMSPSATRSVSMLSFFILAKVLQRPAPSLHTLACSYLTLLFIKPEWMFHIGFQMSYTAVFFILWTYPKLRRLWFPKKMLLKWVWQILLISCIAQIGVMPWTLHYFGKIPGLFLLSNFIVLTLVSILLIGGLLILIAGAIGINKFFIYSVYNFISNQIEAYIDWVSIQDSWIFLVNKPNIAVSLGLFILMLYAFPLTWSFSYQNIRNLAILHLSIIGLIGFYKLDSSKEEIWLLAQFGESLIMHTSPKQIKLLTNQEEVESTYLWNSLTTTYPNKKIAIQKFPAVFKLEESLYLKVDKAFVYSPSIPSDCILLLQESTTQDLDQLITHLNPKLIIADASNYPYKVLQWQEISLKRKIPFLSTLEKGAILLGSKRLF